MASLRTDFFHNQLKFPLAFLQDLHCRRMACPETDMDLAPEAMEGGLDLALPRTGSRPEHPMLNPLAPFTFETLPAPIGCERVVTADDNTWYDTGTVWVVLFPLWSAVTWAAYGFNGHDALLGDLSAEC